MTTDAERFLRCYVVAKRVLHQYWTHTDGDYPELGRIRVENVERATEIISTLKINKKSVDAEALHTRSVTERYATYADILIRENQPVEWLKYCAVKEYSHLLYDTPQEDFETDVVKTLTFLTSNDPFQVDDSHSPAEVSEKMTEILALEIIYPLEWRREDRTFLESGGSISELVDKRHVPAIHIQRGCNEAAFSTSEHIWQLLNELPNSK